MVTRLLRPAGFSLVELLIALVLSTAIGAVVFTVMVVQNRFYSGTSAAGRVQESVRIAGEFLGTEVRPVTRGGFTLAERDHFVARVPTAVGVVCAVSGDRAHIYFALDGGTVPASRVSGYAVRSSSGSWSYTSASWSELFVSSGGSSVTECTSRGNVSSGFPSDYKLLARVGSVINPGAVTGPGGPVGVMLYERVEYRFATSVLEPGTLGLFSGPPGGTLVEYASGFDTSAHFEYRLATGAFVESVSSASLSQVTAVRLVAEATGLAKSGGVTTRYRYGYTVDFPFRNVR